MLGESKGEHEDRQNGGLQVDAESERGLVEQIAPKQSACSIEDGGSGANEGQKVIITNELLTKGLVHGVDELHRLSAKGKHQP